ncbi:MAG TPA: hypothetical protein VGG11_17580 [Xanthobacteraceae bacterium]
MTLPVTVERLDHAISIVAKSMVRHDMGHLIATVKLLEAERDRLRNETDALQYAREILRTAA